MLGHQEALGATIQVVLGETKGCSVLRCPSAAFITLSIYHKDNLPLQTPSLSKKHDLLSERFFRQMRCSRFHSDFHRAFVMSYKLEETGFNRGTALGGRKSLMKIPKNSSHFEGVDHNIRKAKPCHGSRELEMAQNE